MYLKITNKMVSEIESLWKKPMHELTDEDAKDIVEHFTATEVEKAWFSTEDEIFYEESKEAEGGGDIKPEWDEAYLNTLGLSKKDF